MVKLTINNSIQITKSDFLLYCEAPRHLWAKKHGIEKKSLSVFDQHLIDQGYQVEELAYKYIQTILIPQNPGKELLWQKTFSDGPFEARCDALLSPPDLNTYDLYEIKSSTSVDKDDLYDVAYQALIIKSLIDVDHFYLLHLNKDYVRSGEIDISQLFIAEDVSDKVINLLPEIKLLRSDAIKATQETNFDTLPHCFSPNNCQYPDVCHPNLPDFSIYDIPQLTQEKKQRLLNIGIIDAKDIPDSFDLNKKQRLVVERAKTNTVHIDRESLRSEIDRIIYPVYFLDYETCISAIPQYDGYHPQQQIVFQYSLHKVDEPGGSVAHTDHISINKEDPMISLLESLCVDIGENGTIIVWNKTFEMTMNKEMAKVHPEFSDFLEQINQRIYDLGDVVKMGYYLHPGFKGSWSIKNVLPVMVPELSYKELSINKGDEASMAWWNLTFGQIDNCEKELIVEALHKYCKLDTQAMVEILQRILEFSN